MADQNLVLTSQYIFRCISISIKSSIHFNYIISFHQQCGKMEIEYSSLSNDIITRAYEYVYM